MDVETLRLGVRAVDLVPEQFRDPVLVSSDLVAEPLVLLAQENAFYLKRSGRWV